jgi:hypothetical protein
VKTSPLFSYLKKGELSLNTVVSKKQTIISYVIAFFFILPMVTVSEMLKERKLILPEMAAIAIECGYIEKLDGSDSPRRFFLLHLSQL